MIPDELRRKIASAEVAAEGLLAGAQHLADVSRGISHEILAIAGGDPDEYDRLAAAVADRLERLEQQIADTVLRTSEWMETP